MLINGGISLNWAEPVNNGGAAITGYQVSSNGITWVSASSNTGHIFTGFSDGVTYTLGVRAVSNDIRGAARTVTVTYRNLDAIGLFVERLYTLVLNRSSDPGGFQAWTTSLRSGRVTGAQAAHGFVFSNEMINRGLSNEHFVEILYLTLFGRTSDLGGKTHWLGRLNAGLPREDVFASFVNSNEFI
jgi:hypothetical protein